MQGCKVAGRLSYGVLSVSKLGRSYSKLMGIPSYCIRYFMRSVSYFVRSVSYFMRSVSYFIRSVSYFMRSVSYFMRT